LQAEASACVLELANVLFVGWLFILCYYDSLSLHETQRCCIRKVAVLSARNFRRKFRSW